MIRVGVTGGIGSGKSTVCRIFSMLGVAVYNSDLEAKRLMISDYEVRDQIINLFGHEAYCGGELNRKMIASQVFTDSNLLTQLNAIVHPAVFRDFDLWVETQTGKYVIQESAILYESGADQAVDCVIGIIAPLDLRIKRTCSRDNISASDVQARIENQLSEEILMERADYIITSDDRSLVIPQILEINSKICHIG